MNTLEETTTGSCMDLNGTHYKNDKILLVICSIVILNFISQFVLFLEIRYKLISKGISKIIDKGDKSGENGNIHSSCISKLQSIEDRLGKLCLKINGSNNGSNNRPNDDSNNDPDPPNNGQTPTVYNAPSNQPDNPPETVHETEREYTEPVMEQRGPQPQGYQDEAKSISEEILTKTPSNIYINNPIFTVDHLDTIKEERINLFNFYTETKYHFRLILYPKGFGVAKSEYLSLYFQILNGDHDDELNWPMKNKIMLAIVNPETKCRCQKTYSYETCIEDDQDVFEKPFGAENCSFGTSKFIKLSNLEKFVKNNSIMIQFKLLI